MEGEYWNEESPKEDVKQEVEACIKNKCTEYEKPQNPYKYNCEPCVFYTNKKQHYQRHIASVIHTKRLDNVFIVSCKKCNKKFSGRSGLYQHRLKCNAPEITIINNQDQKHIIKETVSELHILTFQLPIYIT